MVLYRLSPWTHLMTAHEATLGRDHRQPAQEQRGKQRQRQVRRRAPGPVDPERRHDHLVAHLGADPGSCCRRRQAQRQEADDDGRDEDDPVPAAVGEAVEAGRHGQTQLGQGQDHGEVGEAVGAVEVLPGLERDHVAEDHRDEGQEGGEDGHSQEDAFHCGGMCPLGNAKKG
ncbi:hypothetical protein PG984_006719 [Apiospora sp. TS-2023a]